MQSIFFLATCSLLAIVQSTPSIGTFSVESLHPWWQPEQINGVYVDRSAAPIGTSAKVVAGLIALGIFHDDDVLCCAWISSTRPDGDGFSININSWANTKLPTAEAAWIGFGGTDRVEYETNIVYYNLGGSEVLSPYSIFWIDFRKPYSKPPKVIAFLNSVGLLHGHNYRLRTWVDDITEYGFNLYTQSWADSELVSAGWTWIAYSAEKKFVASGQETATNYRPWWQPQPYNGGHVTFPAGTFTSTPQIYIAIDGFDIGADPGFRLRAAATDITPEGFDWHCDGWVDSLTPVVYDAGVSWLAFV